MPQIILRVKKVVKILNSISDQMWHEGKEAPRHHFLVLTLHTREFAFFSLNTLQDINRFIISFEF
jgi:hypothetical protein